MRNIVSVFMLAMAGCPAATTTNGIPASGQSAPIVVVREVHDLFESARADISFDGGTMYVDAITPSGIGGVVIELKSGTWPKKIVVRLFYAPDIPFGSLERVIEASSASLMQTGRKADEPWVRQAIHHLTKSGFEVGPIPVTEMKVLYISWVDALRH